MKAVQCRGIDT